MKSGSGSQSPFMIFLKSAVITALSLALVCFLIFGLLFTDESVNSAVGGTGGFEISQFDNNAFIFELSGKEFKIDFRPISEAGDEAMKYYDILPIELRLMSQMSNDGQSLIEKYIKRWFDGGK